MLYAVRIPYMPQDPLDQSSAAETTEGRVCASLRTNNKCHYPVGKVLEGSVIGTHRHLKHVILLPTFRKVVTFNGTQQYNYGGEILLLIRNHGCDLCIRVARAVRSYFVAREMKQLRAHFPKAITHFRSQLLRKCELYATPNSQMDAPSF